MSLAAADINTLMLFIYFTHLFVGNKLWHGHISSSIAVEMKWEELLFETLWNMIMMMVINNMVISGFVSQEELRL